MAFQFLGLLKILAAGGSLYKTRLDHEVTSNCNIKNAVGKTLVCSRSTAAKEVTAPFSLTNLKLILVWDKSARVCTA